MSVSKDWWDRFDVIFTGLLVLVAGLAALFAYRTLKAIESQAGIMQEQLRTMGSQLSAMRESGRQTDKLIEHADSQAKALLSTAEAAINQAQAATVTGQATALAAEAAKASADATRQSVEMFINKERARLRVKVADIDLSPLPKPLFHMVKLRVLCTGSTEAIILEAGAEAIVVDSIDPPGTLDSSLLPITGLPPAIGPTTSIAESGIFVRPLVNFSQADLDSINERKSFLHCYGFIKYMDVFGRERSTRFRYVWRVTHLPISGQRLGYWLKCGNKEDNEQT